MEAFSTFEEDCLTGDDNFYTGVNKLSCWAHTPILFMSSSRFDVGMGAFSVVDPAYIKGPGDAANDLYITIELEIFLVSNISTGGNNAGRLTEGDTFDLGQVTVKYYEITATGSVLNHSLGCNVVNNREK